MKDLIELMKKAEEIYDLGIRMQETFSADETTKKHYMIMAIAAGLKDKTVRYQLPVSLSDNIGEQIKQMRIDAKYTLRQIEDATGISNSYLSQLENGKIKKPSFEVLKKIQDFIIDGISVENDDLILPR